MLGASRTLSPVSSSSCRNVCPLPMGLWGRVCRYAASCWGLICCGAAGLWPSGLRGPDPQTLGVFLFDLNALILAAQLQGPCAPCQACFLLRSVSVKVELLFIREPVLSVAGRSWCCSLVQVGGNSLNVRGKCRKAGSEAALVCAVGFAQY